MRIFGFVFGLRRHGYGLFVVRSRIRLLSLKGMRSADFAAQISLSAKHLINLNIKYPDDIRKRKSHILQRRNAADCQEVILSVISVIGESVGFGKLEKPDLGVAAQHSDTDPGQL